MKSKLIQVLVFLCLRVSSIAQSPVDASYLTVYPQNGISEGGEIKLLGAGSNSQILMDNFDGRFRVFNTSEFFSVNQNGQVGIGTGGPVNGSKLDVSGAIATNGQLAVNSNSSRIWLGDLSEGDGLRTLSLVSYNTEALVFNNNGSYDVIGGGFNFNRIASPIAGSGISGQIFQLTNLIGTSDGLVYQADHHQFRNYDGTSEMTLSDGKVGIGTVGTPQAKLDVFGSIKIPAATNSDNLSPGLILVANDDFIYDGEYINHYGFGFHHFSGSALNGPNAYVSGFFGLDLFTEGQNRFRILQNGNVGIGTTTPSELLSVNGTIRSKEVKVEASPWPDYVFEDDYSLTPLSELETYVKENHHLPELPTEAEVIENGVEVSATLNLLLKKIEELTLYTIEQQKEIEELRKLIVNQK